MNKTNYIDTLIKYTRYYLTNNIEVLDDDDILEIKRALKDATADAIMGDHAAAERINDILDANERRLIQANETVIKYAKYFLAECHRSMTTKEYLELRDAVEMCEPEHPVDAAVSNKDKCLAMYEHIHNCYEAADTNTKWDAFVNSNYTIGFKGKVIKLQNDADTYELIRQFLKDLAEVNE